MVRRKSDRLFIVTSFFWVAALAIALTIKAYPDVLIFWFAFGAFAFMAVAFWMQFLIEKRNGGVR